LAYVLRYNENMQEFVVSPDDVGVRVDVFVAKQYPQFARSALEILFDNSLVQINGETAKAGTKLHEGDAVAVDETSLFSEPEPIDLLIIYEDQNVIVINKPVGILTHSKGSLNTEGTVASFLLPKIADKELTGNRAGIVHRLDRATSGVIIVAKNAEALKHLQKQFAQRKTKKTYIAVAEGWPEPAEAIIDAPIERNPKKPQTFRVGPTGKTAQTQYKTIDRFEKNGQQYALLELKPVTGRTHQLRVHLAFIGHPILGDRVYGKAGDYMYLHAESLEITLPGGVREIFEAPLPTPFKEFIKNE
jgi:23S rRNA pseudouridine1911/1915/1917 synthase